MQSSRYDTTWLLSLCVYSTLTGSQMSPVVGCACLGYTPKKCSNFVTNNSTEKCFTPFEVYVYFGN